jgi:phosphoglycolate phosphatase
MKFPEQKLLLFDFDGVLVDSLELYENVVRQCLEEIGKPIVKNLDDFLALFHDNFYQGIVNKGIDLQAYMAAMKGIYPSIDLSLIKPHREMASVLLELAERHRLMLISSNHEKVIRVLLNKMNVEGCFEAVLGSEAVLSKTEKIAFAQVQCGVAKERIFYIGDTTGDIREARRAGVKAIAVTWGWHNRQILETVYPDYLIDTPYALLDLFTAENFCNGC